MGIALRELQHCNKCNNRNSESKRKMKRWAI